MKSGPALRRKAGRAPSVGFADTSPALFGAGEERKAHSSSLEGNTSGEVSPQVTEGAAPR